MLMTASELFQQAQRICRATSIPLLVDADHGYGNALNVGRTIEDLATVGVAAATIEDTICQRHRSRWQIGIDLVGRGGRQDASRARGPSRPGLRHRRPYKRDPCFEC